MIELETHEAFKNYLDSGRPWKDVAVQAMDLTEFSGRLVTCDFNGSVFLGCKLSNDVLERIIDTGGLYFPEIPGLPYKAFRDSLYTLDTLFDRFDPQDPASYEKTTDGKIYRHFLATGKGEPDSILESLARRLHDHAITDALREFLNDFGHKYRVVGVMGGHSLRRGDEDYKKVALIARSLARLGYLMISGGGPGAMEATHVGVWFAGYGDGELDEAIGILSQAPHYRDREWLSRAFEVIKKFPAKEYNGSMPESLGIPTWFYGHEPPTPFPSMIAKYFANSVREEGLLAIALGGVIFSPGKAGTVQEIFQDACQNRYKTFGIASPMIFLNRKYWEEERPVYPLLKKLAQGQDYFDVISIADDAASVVKSITAFKPPPG